MTYPESLNPVQIEAGDAVNAHICEVCAEVGWCPTDNFDDPNVAHVTVTELGREMRFRFKVGTIWVTTTMKDSTAEVESYSITGQCAPDRYGHVMRELA